jgi:hypothetical protein
MTWRGEQYLPGFTSSNAMHPRLLIRIVSYNVILPISGRLYLEAVARAGHQVRHRHDGLALDVAAKLEFETKFKCGASYFSFQRCNQERSTKSGHPRSPWGQPASPHLDGREHCVALLALFLEAELPAPVGWQRLRHGLVAVQVQRDAAVRQRITLGPLFGST